MTALMSQAAVAFPRRGEVYWLDFNPATGAEMRDMHPAAVVQNDVANQASALTIVAAITSNLRVADLPVGVRVEPHESGLRVPSVIHLGHLHTIDKRRLQRRIAILPPHILTRVEEAVQISLGVRPFRLT